MISMKNDLNFLFNLINAVEVSLYFFKIKSRARIFPAGHSKREVEKQMFLLLHITEL
jgi:hypothetical protein